MKVIFWCFFSFVIVYKCVPKIFFTLQDLHLSFMLRISTQFAGNEMYFTTLLKGLHYFSQKSWKKNALYNHIMEW